ncbi:MAG: hypothetical protein ACUVV4_06700 [Candidatus Bathyarchaeia archaeon]
MSSPSGRGENEWGIALFLTEEAPESKAWLDAESSRVICKTRFVYKCRVYRVKALGGFHPWSL